jgi:hypothetical protein
MDRDQLRAQPERNAAPFPCSGQGTICLDGRLVRGWSKARYEEIGKYGEDE